MDSQNAISRLSVKKTNVKIKLTICISDGLEGDVDLDEFFSISGYTSIESVYVRRLGGYVRELLGDKDP